MSRLWVNYVLLILFELVGVSLWFGMVEHVGLWGAVVGELALVVAWFASDYFLSVDYYGFNDRLVALVAYPLTFGSVDGVEVRVQLRRIIFSGDDMGVEIFE